MTSYYISGNYAKFITAIPDWEIRRGWFRKPQIQHLIHSSFSLFSFLFFFFFCLLLSSSDISSFIDNYRRHRAQHWASRHKTPFVSMDYWLGSWNNIDLFQFCCASLLFLFLLSPQACARALQSSIHPFNHSSVTTLLKMLELAVYDFFTRTSECGQWSKIKYQPRSCCKQHRWPFWVWSI